MQLFSVASIEFLWKYGQRNTTRYTTLKLTDKNLQVLADRNPGIPNSMAHNGKCKTRLAQLRWRVFLLFRKNRGWRGFCLRRATSFLLKCTLFQFKFKPNGNCSPIAIWIGIVQYSQGLLEFLLLLLQKAWQRLKWVLHIVMHCSLIASHLRIFVGSEEWSSAPARCYAVTALEKKPSELARIGFAGQGHIQIAHVSGNDWMPALFALLIRKKQFG